ncbi:MAG: GNAT family N-acetyltransferase [Caulobacter sp.]|nr:GNAT family N-acetyltransferase [Caulobacter sp.]
MTIRTARLRLEPAAHSDLLAVGLGEDVLAQTLGVSIAPQWAGADALDAISRTRDRLAADPALAQWWMHFIIHEADNTLIGLGGFKGAPEGGQVEIGYEIAPGYRLRGLATEAARGMVDHALADPRVDHVLAHTLPVDSASTTFLQRLGLRFIEALDDPDDGPVWRWRLDRVR